MTSDVVQSVYTQFQFTVTNVVTRVNIDGHDDTSSQLTQYALELLTATLAQLSSDMQTRGKFY